LASDSEGSMLLTGIFWIFIAPVSKLELKLTEKVIMKVNERDWEIELETKN